MAITQVLEMQYQLNPTECLNMLLVISTQNNRDVGYRVQIISDYFSYNSTITDLVKGKLKVFNIYAI